MTTFTDAQWQAISDPGSVAIAAGAGSGKTRVLAERITHLLGQGVHPGRIVAVTFTEAAAAELRSRVGRFVEERLRAEGGDWLRISGELPAMVMGTIHSLCGRIAREHPLESGASLTFEVLDPLMAKLWLDDHLERVLAELPQDVLLAVPGKIRRGAIEALLNDPTSAQGALKVALEHLSLSPQERAIRAWDAVRPAWIRLVDDLAALAGPGTDELERIRQMVIRSAGGAPIMGSRLRAVRSAFETYKGSIGKGWDKDAKAAVHAALKGLRTLALRDDLLGEATADSARHDAALKALDVMFGHVTARFGELKAEQAVATFNDLEVYAARALESDEVRRYYARRWTHLLIDESQDTNPVQWQVLSALMGEGVNVTVVGDEKQGIYGFRRADIQVIRQAREFVAARGGCVIPMHTSFRTHAALVEAVNAFFGSLMRGPDELRPTATPFEPLIADRAEAPSDEPGVEVHVLQGDQGLREAEAAYLAQRIQALLLGGQTVYDRETGQLRPVRLGDIAFLFRARTDLKVYEEFLTLAGIGYQVLGGVGLLQRQEVQDALHLLLAVDDPHRDVSLAALLRSPVVHLTDQELLDVASLRGAGESLWQGAGRSDHPAVQAACGLIHDLRERSATASMGQLLSEVDGRTGLFAVHAAQPDGGRRHANLRQFQALLRTWALEGQRDLASVALRLQQMLRLQAQAAEGSSASEHAVKLMTIHGSKGLEFPVVIYADALRQGGGFPPVVRFDPEVGVALRLPRLEGDLPEWDALEVVSKERELSEDERLAYVAFTRAADLLILSVTARDTGAALERASTFLRHLPDTGVSRTYLAPGQVTAPEPLGMIFDVPRPILPVRSGPGTVLPSTLPVTSVATYLTCPRRFAFRHVEGRLPLAALWSELEELARLNPEGRVAGRQIGDAVHQAMEHGWRGEELLSKVNYLALPDQQQVVTLVQAFSKPVFASVNTRTYQREKPIQVPLGGILFEGVVDAFDTAGGLVLDYKTDRSVSPEHHLPQLSLYARHLGASEAVLAYLRHDHLHQFSTQDLQEGYEWVREAVDSMNHRQFEPAPQVHKCRRCEFRGVCDAAVNDAVVSA